MFNGITNLKDDVQFNMVIDNFLAMKDELKGYEPQVIRMNKMQGVPAEVRKVLQTTDDGKYYCSI